MTCITKIILRLKVSRSSKPLRYSFIRMDFILVSWEFLQLPQRQLAQHLLQATPHPHRHQVQAGLHI